MCIRDSCITLPAKPTSVYESMGITKLESDAASVAHCITLPAKPTSVYESMGIVNAAPTRADITTLTITPDNIEELHHLGEYTSLLTLNCSNLGLTKLPSILPPKLKKLWCDHNALTDFPVLPKSLRELNYSHNKFTRVPSVNVSMVINYGNPWDTDQIPPDERILNRQWELLYKTPIDDILDNPYQTKAHEQPISRKQATPVKKHVVVPTPAPEPRLIMLPKRLSAVPTLDPLIWACSRRNVVHALEFINAAAPICVDKNGDTALIWACANKMPEVALKLVARDLLLGHVDREGNTALIWACVHNMREVIDALMSTDKAKVDHVNRRKQTAKMWIEHHRRNFEAEEAKKAAAQSEPNRGVVVEPSEPNRGVVVEPSEPNRDVVVEPSEPNRGVVVEPSAPNRDVVVEPSEPNRDVAVEPSEPNRGVVVEPETEVRHKKTLTIVLNLSSNEALNVAMLAQWRPFKKTYDGKTTYSGYDMRCIETQVPTFYQGHTLYQVPALYPTIAATFSDKPSTRFFDSTTEVNQWLSTVLPRAFALNVPEDAKSEDSFIILETDKV
jgi:Leucine-rich repeat (LRR) protein